MLVGGNKTDTVPGLSLEKGAGINQTITRLLVERVGCGLFHIET